MEFFIFHTLDALDALFMNLETTFHAREDLNRMAEIGTSSVRSTEITTSAVTYVF